MCKYLNFKPNKIRLKLKNKIMYCSNIQDNNKILFSELIKFSYRKTLS